MYYRNNPMMQKRNRCQNCGAIPQQQETTNRQNTGCGCENPIVPAEETALITENRECGCSAEPEREYDRYEQNEYQNEKRNNTRSVGADSCLTTEVFTIEGCNDYIRYDIGEMGLSGQGRFINASITLRRVCPGRRIALGVTLTELDDCGREHSRGFKAFEVTVPRCGCGNLRVTDILFVLPQDSDPSGCSCICRNRRFRIRATANYIDTNVCM